MNYPLGIILDIRSGTRRATRLWRSRTPSTPGRPKRISGMVVRELPADPHLRSPDSHTWELLGSFRAPLRG